MKLIEDIEITGRLEDSSNPGVSLIFKSTRADLSKRAFKIMGDISRLVKLAEAGQDYKNTTIYFSRYQPFIDEFTKEFRVKSISTYTVQK
jgi:hypothetical protein